MKSMFLCSLFVSVFTTGLFAAEGEPVAVRSWPNGVVSIENQWGLSLAIVPRADDKVSVPDDVDQVIVVEQAEWGHVLSRLPNQPKTTWGRSTSDSMTDANAMTVRSMGPTMTRIDVDGVGVVVATGDLSQNKVGDSAGDFVDVDALVLCDVGPGQMAHESVVSVVDTVNPRWGLPLAVNPDQVTGKGRTGNTFAVSASERGPEETETVLLSQTPWEMPEDLAAMFDAMEKACRKSQEVFAELSVSQLNFQPANGTHTPRWNAEHMMGRQLLFFSQIYHAIDPAVTVMDLNPKQMPKDYEFAHPDWDGVEEARQMQRASDFCRRFAYLLDGIELNEKAPGSRWPSLRALLVQMQKHYGEHTANTQKKFALPGWPEASGESE
ncbi:DinB family protein [Rhodopirellula sallentina]|uniref:Putative secreted protein n=1 Tax=Rhodopirellula sallentina SM41 TaxID=1263870 RepID=M5UD66_9BACT|nr:DinB family protein [Rhodopirellula sallentina]EMI53958.1 putative secreted protein [Rhodopirellula sallentina SM41]